MLRSFCPRCHKKIKYDESLEGSHQKCPRCSTGITLRATGAVESRRTSSPAVKAVKKASASQEPREPIAIPKRVLLGFVLVPAAALLVASLLALSGSKNSYSCAGLAKSVATKGSDTFIFLDDAKKGVVPVMANAQTTVVNRAGWKSAPASVEKIQVGQLLEVYLDRDKPFAQKIVITRSN